jgi:hypothetical protein
MEVVMWKFERQREGRYESTQENRRDGVSRCLGSIVRECVWN